jgi:hypothetical protein
MARQKIRTHVSVGPTAEYRAIIRNALPLRGLAIDTFECPDKLIRVHTVYVTTDKRPDVADFLRVHSFEQEGAVQTRWGLFQGPNYYNALLDMRFTAPAVCNFALLFPIKSPGVQEWLTGVEAVGRMGITNGPHTTGEPVTHGIIFELTGAPLSVVIERALLEITSRVRRG